MDSACRPAVCADFRSAAVDRLSGTLSDAMATSMWNLSAFLANNLRLSGTLPQQHTFYQIVSNISHTCDWITDAEECSIAAASLGIVASLSKSANMSLHPPYCHFDATTNTPGFNSLIHTGVAKHACVGSGDMLCWGQGIAARPTSAFAALY